MSSDDFLPASVFFAGQRLDLERYSAMIARLGQPIVLATLTPGRCGSTYFADLVKQTGLCGNGNEIFGERHVHRWSETGTDFCEFFANAAQANLIGGVLWFRITPDQFEDLEKLVDPAVLRTWRFSSIFRRDILAQAISFVYAIHSGIWHANETEREVSLDADLERLAGQVQFRLLNLQLSELKAHRITERFATPPHLIQFYEDIVSSPREEMLRFFRDVGIEYELRLILECRADFGGKLAKRGDIELHERVIQNLAWVGPLLAARKQILYTSKDSLQKAPRSLPDDVTTAMNQTLNIQSATEAAAQLEAAIQLARTGQRREAREVVTKSVAASLPDLVVLHKAGVVLRACGDYEEALASFHQALQISPGFHFTEIEIGGVHADLGRHEEALSWYYKAIDSAPDYVRSYVLAARLEQQLGRNHLGVALLERASAVDPGNRDIQIMLAKFLVYQERRTDAVAVYQRVIESGLAEDHDHVDYVRLLSETDAYDRAVAHSATLSLQPGSMPRHQLTTLVAHAKLAQHYDRDTVIAEATAREAGPNWRSAAGVARAVREAIAYQRPFSMIRLGDGEARFLIYGSNRVSGILTREEAFATGESIWINWFGQSLAQTDLPSVTRLQAALMQSVAGADIVGVPAAARLCRDFAHFGYLACLIEMIDEIADDPSSTKMADASVNIELHRASPFYRDVLDGLDFLGVISPHPELAERLGRNLGIAHVASHVIPGEMRLPERPGLARGSGHFPQRYTQLLADLTIPRPGAVFLVAGGLLGKLYCGHIKRSGGVALDVGAVVDAWMGYDTRPGSFERQTLWKLP